MEVCTAGGDDLIALIKHDVKNNKENNREQNSQYQYDMDKVFVFQYALKHHIC